jgi:phage terminase Nu1 subunit (DNA packaging protein)
LPSEDEGPKGIARSLRQLADVFGVRPDTISRNWVPNGMPRKRDGTYDLAKIYEWKRTRLRDHQSPSHLKRDGKRGGSTKAADADAVIRKRLAEARCKEAEAEKRELENQVRARSVVPRDDVVLLFSEMILTAKQRLLQLPERLMMRFPRELRTELTNEVREQIELVLMEMSDYRPDELTSPEADDSEYEEDDDAIEPEQTSEDFVEPAAAT